MAGKIIIDTERCKGCGLCVVVCPKDCIVISKKSNRNGYFPAQANNADCTSCAACASRTRASICPSSPCSGISSSSPSGAAKTGSRLPACSGQRWPSWPVTSCRPTEIGSRSPSSRSFPTAVQSSGAGSWEPGCTRPSRASRPTAKSCQHGYESEKSIMLTSAASPPITVYEPRRSMPCARVLRRLCCSN